MPTLCATRSRPARPIAPLLGLHTVLFWLAALQRRHRERMQLAEMDDAALKDIGLSRCDALAESCKPRWRR